MLLRQGLVDAALGIFALLVPAWWSQAPVAWLGFLFVLSASVQIARAYTTRALPGFLPALIGGVAALVFGLLLWAYPTDRSVTTPLLLSLLFASQSACASLWAKALHQLPYTQGFKVLAALSATFSVLLVVSPVKTDPLFYSLFTGGHLLLQGALLSGVALGVQALGQGQWPLHPLEENGLGSVEATLPLSPLVAVSAPPSPQAQVEASTPSAPLSEA
jgi:uncharacterized membrane protein HdeD (DUF308 family)